MTNFPYRTEQISELVSEITDSQVREGVEIAALPEILEGCSYFLDVGANAGQYTFHAAKHLRHARILAIEANPYLIPLLTQTVEDLRSNDSRDNEYEIVATAVSDVRGWLDFYVSAYPQLSSLFPQSGGHNVKVPAVPLDDFYRDSDKTVVKVDVEGAEYRVLKSGSRFLASRTTLFFAELHGWGDRSLRKYPVHVCWLFLANQYAVRKIGTHYLFYPAGRLACLTTFLAQFPYLALKSVKHSFLRYRRTYRLTVRRMREKLSR